MPDSNDSPTHPLSLAIWNFSSSWFLLPQGTGITSVVLHQLHYQFGALPILAKIVWIYTIVLLALFLLIYLLRTILYPRHVLHELYANIGEASCLSCTSISLTAIIEMISLQYSSHGAGLAAYVLWWTNTFFAILFVLIIPYIQLKLQPSGIERVPPSFLLPVIAALTAAAGGAVICVNSPLSPRLQVPVIIVSYLQAGAGFALAICFDAVVIYHHFNLTYPARDMVYQDMILCGPFGQGSFALQALGSAVGNAFGPYHRGTFLTAQAGEVIQFVSQFAGLLAWGVGTFWWLFAILSIAYTLFMQPGGWRETSFTMTTWALIFPWGVYTNAAVNLGKLMDSPAFYVYSTVLLLLLVVLAILLTLLTLRGIITGKVLGLENGWRRVPEPKLRTV